MTVALPGKISRGFKLPRLGTGSLQLNIGIVIFTILVLALFGQFIFLSSSALDGDLPSRLQPGFWRGYGHVFGTDQLGRDLLYRVMGGLPWSLGIAGTATLILASIGTIVGLLGAW